MKRVSFSVGALLLAVVLLTTAAVAETPSSSAQVEASLAELHQFLGEGDAGQRWRTFLGSSELAAELNKGNDADPSAVAEVLQRYSGSAAGLEMPQFVAVRTALTKWHREISQAPPANLSQMARDAAGKFETVSAQDVARSRSELQSALAELDAFLKNSSPEHDAGWRKYLRWDEFSEQTRRPEGIEPSVAAAVISRLSAYEKGLDMPQFVRVRRALRRHVDLVAAFDAKAAESYGKQLEDLAARLDSHAQSGSADDALAIGRSVRWLRRSGQAPDLTAAIERHFSRPNLFASVSERFLSAGLEDDVDRTQGVTDVILGTRIQGTAHTTGRTHVDVVANDRAAQFDILLTGQAASSNVGRNGPVTIYSTGLTNISGRKILVANEEGLYGYGATASCATSTNIYAIESCCNLIEQLAWSRAMQQKAQAEAIASSHAAGRVAGQMDAQAADLIADANQRYHERLRQPLASRDGFPQKLEFRSTSDQIDVKGLALGSGGLAAADAPPEIGAGHDVAVRAHESAIVNFGEAMLGGVTLTDERLEKIIRDDLQAEVPEELQITPEKDPWSITFADDAPVRAVFAGGQLGLSIRGRRFTRGDQAISEPIEISAKYTIEKTATGTKLTRQGEVDVKFLDRERLGAQQVAFKTFMTRKFEALFKPEIVSEGIVLKGRLEKAGKLQVQEIASDKGWIAIGWQLAAPPKPAEVAAIE